MKWLIKLITIKGLFRSLTAMCNNAAHYATIAENIRETRNSLLLLSGVNIVDNAKYNDDVTKARELEEQLAKLKTDVHNTIQELGATKDKIKATNDTRREIQMEADQIALVIKEREQLLDKLNAEIAEKAVIVDEVTLEAKRQAWFDKNVRAVKKEEITDFSDAEVKKQFQKKVKKEAVKKHVEDIFGKED